VETAPPVSTAAEAPLPAAAQEPLQMSATAAATSAPQTTDETRVSSDQTTELAQEMDPDKPDTQPSSGPFQLQDLRILDPQVKRFVLPRTVVNKEPRGEIGGIRLKPDGSAAVWCYSEVIGRPGTVLHYVWYHEGRRMARVRIKVRGNRWRSYSSKIINRRHQGSWRVELQDSAGRLLASAEFSQQ
jgi:hypothetical protein